MGDSDRRPSEAKRYPVLTLAIVVALSLTIVGVFLPWRTEDFVVFLVFDADPVGDGSTTGIDDGLGWLVVIASAGAIAALLARHVSVGGVLTIASFVALVLVCVLGYRSSAGTGESAADLTGTRSPPSGPGRDAPPTLNR